MSTAGAGDIERLTILDVGHGNCAVLEVRGDVVVVDAGPGSALLEFLDQHGIDTIHTFFLSHADHDHIAGLIAVLATGRFAVRRVRVNSDAMRKSNTWRSLAYLLAKDKAIDFDVSLTSSGHDDLMLGDVRIEVIAPSPFLAVISPGGKSHKGRPITTNSISAVIRISKGTEPVALLAGDLDDVGLDDLLDFERPGQAPLLVFPHHGGNAGGNLADFMKRLCDLVQPSFVLFSIGRGRFGTPQPDVVTQLIARNPTIRISCTQLSKHCAKTVPLAAPSHLADVYARGRANRACCAGSVVINLTAESQNLPIWSTYQDFITSNTDAPLCRRK